MANSSSAAVRQRTRARPRPATTPRWPGLPGSVIADEHAGLAAAVRKFLPEARRQRCTVHLQRNVGAKVPHRLRKRVAREVAQVFQASGLAESKKLLVEFKARWQRELPEAVEVLERGFGAATQFYAFPEAHWPRLRTTNGPRATAR